MQNINIHYYSSPCGELILGSFNGQLCLSDWRYRKMRTSIDNRVTKHLRAAYTEKKDAVIEQAIAQLEEYFAGNRTEFDIPLLFAGTDFQKTVWEALIKIEYGKTASYLALAEHIGNPAAVRAVANANGANALSIFVPCHRIIGKNNNLVGYAGGIDAKKQLLSLEYNLFS